MTVNKQPSLSPVALWWTDDNIEVFPVSATNPLPVTGSISATNPSVGVNGSPAPTSSTEVGFIDGSGNEVGVSAANPLPITGTISATNPSVGTNTNTAPTSSTEIGWIDGSGKLQGGKCY